MATFDPFTRLPGKHGAPMGRTSSGTWNGKERLYVRYQGGGEGYDKGGAYWGLPSNVYAVFTRGGKFVRYVRAGSKAQALALINGADND